MLDTLHSNSTSTLARLYLSAVSGALLACGGGREGERDRERGRERRREAQILTALVMTRPHLHRFVIRVMVSRAIHTVLGGHVANLSKKKAAGI